MGLITCNLSPILLHFKYSSASFQNIGLNFVPQALGSFSCGAQETGETFRDIYSFPDQCCKNLIFVRHVCHDRNVAGKIMIAKIKILRQYQIPVGDPAGKLSIVGLKNRICVESIPP